MLFESYQIGFTSCRQLGAGIFLVSLLILLTIFFTVVIWVMELSLVSLIQVHKLQHHDNLSLSSLFVYNRYSTSHLMKQDYGQSPEFSEMKASGQFHLVGGVSVNLGRNSMPRHTATGKLLERDGTSTDFLLSTESH